LARFFKCKYVEYPRFKKKWRAYRRTYHRLVWDELVNRALKEKGLVGNARAMVNDIEDLQEVWDTLDTCYDRPEKYFAEALEPIIEFRKYGVFENGTIREFYSLLRSTMLGTRRAGLLHRWSRRRCGTQGSGQSPLEVQVCQATGYTGFHPPWLCKAFGDKAQEERSKIIKDNKLCPFCQLHK
jgi:hypothetical protein